MFSDQGHGRQKPSRHRIVDFTLFRLGGGGGIPYAIQNVLPVLFNISIKNYFLGTFIGSWPTMFISVALGAGVEKYIETNEKLSLVNIVLSPDIYLPILGFILMLLVLSLIHISEPTRR